MLLGRTAVHQERTLTWLGQFGWETFILPTPTSRAIINTGKKCGPSVAADGDLWTVYKLQSWNQQRCPKYVIRIDQSEWQGKHSLVRVPRLTNLPWRMGPSRGYRLIFFPRSPNRTSAFAFRRLDSVTQGQVGGTIIWSRMKCIAIVVFYHLIFTAQNGLWASPILTYLKRGVWPVNGPSWFDEVSFYCSPLLSFIFWYIL